MFYEDLEYAARSLPPTHPPSAAGTTFPTSSQWEEQLLTAATYISELCSSLDLDIICLQPFMHFGGLTCRKEHASRIRQLKLWFVLAHRLNTDLIQMPSSFLPESECTGDLKAIAADLREAADLGAKHVPPIRFAYEALCWGTHANTWEGAWEVVKAVDRPNFGTCLDTFNILGRIYGDPAAPSGRTPNAEQAVEASLQRMRTQLDPKKIFYVEVVDAERLTSLLRPGHPWHDPEQDPRMSWSRNARLFPCEEARGGYMPVLEILRTITEDIGYEGFVSFELFSRTMAEVGEGVPEEHARRGERSWGRVCEAMGWEEAKTDDGDVGLAGETR